MLNNDAIDESTEGEETITFNINMMTQDQIELIWYYVYLLP